MRSEMDRLCDRLGIHADVVMSGELPEDWTDRNANAWMVTLRFGRRRMTVPFYTGSAIYTEPTAADVLHCLASDARAGEQSFRDFCSDFGYDDDSRKAEATWKACAKTAPKLRRFLGEHFDSVANAEH